MASRPIRSATWDAAIKSQSGRGRSFPDVYDAGADDNPMEMSATIAAWEGDDHLTVWDATHT